jgi:cytochrome c-type biogenesis protein CcmH
MSRASVLKSNTRTTASSTFSQRRPLYLSLAALAIMLSVWTWLAFAVPRPETLDQQVHDVASQLRCPVCQGESVADAPSMLAQQMRSVIRSQLAAGKSKQQVIDYFLSRYSAQDIVWSPPWQGFTLLAWLVPIVLLLAGLVLLVFIWRDWRLQSTTQTSRADSVVLAVDTTKQDDTNTDGGDDAVLSEYRAKLEQELADEDALFRPVHGVSRGGKS